MGSNIPGKQGSFCQIVRILSAALGSVKCLERTESDGDMYVCSPQMAATND